MKSNQEIAKIFCQIEEMLKINSVPFKPRAYKKAAEALESLKEDVSVIYKNKGIKGLKEISGIGESIAKKSYQYLSQILSPNTL